MFVEVGVEGFLRHERALKRSLPEVPGRLAWIFHGPPLAVHFAVPFKGFNGVLKEAQADKSELFGRWWCGCQQAMLAGMTRFI